MEAHRHEASSDSDKEESSGSGGKTPIPTMMVKKRLRRWLTTYGKTSDGIGGVPHALCVYSSKTTGSYVRTLFYRRVRDFELPKLVQASFYTMLLNDAVGLDIVGEFIAADLKASLEGLRWERWSERRKMILFPNFTNTKEDYHGLWLSFNLDVATWYAHDSDIPEMVQAIVYAMVLNDKAELGLSCRIDMNYTMSFLRRPH
ncbi:LOW QUALITY PROTEIN: hypothetical protein Cgig2_020579 [Carnegiea gigantea]|uniref:Uncharacterized protein n=1 Tax=Carnegiea gigantea TaxID=171969 RepID=A0A9Q1JXM0_9CARY|nr:LOW QUALITY PROTEIN: hypothetical protein Cgig2_020579 [Carnegiea gigantea]